MEGVSRPIAKGRRPTDVLTFPAFPVTLIPDQRIRNVPSEEAPVFYSKTAQYSLQAMLYLAANGADRPLLARDVAARLSLPTSFLGKIMQHLGKAGFLVSLKGPHGGFTLSELGARATPADVIAAIDGPLPLEECILGFAQCSDTDPCPLHQKWARIRSEVASMVGRKTIVELARQLPDAYRTMPAAASRPSTTRSTSPAKPKPTAPTKKPGSRR